VVNLTPTDPLPSQKFKTPFEESVAAETLRLTDVDGYKDAARFQQGMEQALRESGVFRSVLNSQAADYQVDLILRGTVGGEFRSSKFLNFITWWPGPVVMMHSWRGRRFTYVARAEIEMLDARTGTVVGSYHLENRHELVHRSASPWHALGVVIIIPGVIKGALSIDPDQQYRSALYAAAYSDLWKKLGVRIIAERGSYHAERRREQVERCGAKLNGPPVVDAAWSEFAACQTGRFRPRREEDTPGGRVTVYVNEARSIEVHVMGGVIVRWLSPK
jgi:hypothetical protein